MILYELAEELLYLRDAYQNDESITDDMLMRAEIALEQQVKSYCILVKEIKAEENAIADQKRKLTSRQSSLAGNREKILGALHNIQTEVNMPKVSVDGHRSSIVKKPRSITIEDESLIPDKYIQTKISYNRALVKSELKETGEVAEGFGLSEPETYIKVS